MPHPQISTNEAHASALKTDRATRNRKPGSTPSAFRLKKPYLVIILVFIIAGGYIAYAKASSGSAGATYVTAQV